MFLPHIKFMAVHFSKLNMMGLDVSALWICKIIRLSSHDLYLSLLLIFSIIVGTIVMSAQFSLPQIGAENNSPLVPLRTFVQCRFADERRMHSPL
jgi:hypothetical protein